MTRSLSRAVPIALTVLLGLAFGPAQTAEAAAFRVTPIRVDFDGRTQSALLTLINESDEQIRFQISAFSWRQDAQGEMKLDPTQDVVFFPALLTLNAREQRKVRIGRSTAPGTAEKTYRVFFEELPAMETKDKPKGTGVKILTKMGIPVFVAPDKSQPAGDVTNVAWSAGKVSFDVRNTGNVSFVARAVRVRGLDAGGSEVLNKQKEGWYVLGGDTRHYDLELTAEECRKIRKIVIEAETDLAAKPEQSVLRAEAAAPGSCSE